jgi:hypothetical protein
VPAIVDVILKRVLGVLLLLLFLLLLSERRVNDNLWMIGFELQHLGSSDQGVY